MNMGQEQDIFPRLPAPLLAWYDTHARVLPWRGNPAPYRVWISEIMLQQTRVEAVKPYFERFLAELPDLEALAAAPEDVLLKLWEGLGYYNRVRNLRKAAKAILERYGGVFPSSCEELMSLPGIGEYTAGALASISFGGSSRIHCRRAVLSRGGRQCIARDCTCHGKSRGCDERQGAWRDRLTPESGLSGGALRRFYAEPDGTRRDGLSAERRTEMRGMSACGALPRFQEWDRFRTSRQDEEESAA